MLKKHNAEYLACSAPGACTLENKLTIQRAGNGQLNSGSFGFSNPEITA